MVAVNCTDPCVVNEPGGLPVPADPVPPSGGIPEPLGNPGDVLTVNPAGDEAVWAPIPGDSDITALSVLGRSTAPDGPAAPIVAANDHEVLRRNGASIGFGPINISQSAAVTGVLSPSNGGTGVANDPAATLTRSGNHAVTLVTAGATNITLPTSGTLATLAGVETFANKTLTSPVLNGPVTGTSVIPPAQGGTGVANNAAATLARVGNHAVTFTTTATTNVTFPTSGTLATLAGAETFTNKTLTSPVINGLATGTAVVQSSTDVTAGRLLTVGAGPAQAFRRGNILGTVSQLAGVPTGDLIESGSGPNGYYERYASGLQICWHAVTISLTITNGFEGGFRSNGQNWSFPAAFVGQPSMGGYVVGATAFGIVAHSNPSSITGTFAFTAVTSQGVAIDRSAHLIAIGRWF